VTSQVQPSVSWRDRALRIVFRGGAALMSGSRALEVVVDMDEFSDPAGIEILGVRATLGPCGVELLPDLLEGSDVRFGYDPETDAATIGLSIATGTRVRESIPVRATAALGLDGQLLSLEMNVPQGRR
jgi:hypothetical protein